MWAAFTWIDAIVTIQSNVQPPVIPITCPSFFYNMPHIDRSLGEQSVPSSQLQVTSHIRPHIVLHKYLQFSNGISHQCRFRRSPGHSRYTVPCFIIWTAYFLRFVTINSIDLYSATVLQCSTAVVSAEILLFNQGHQTALLWTKRASPSCWSWWCWSRWSWWLPWCNAMLRDQWKQYGNYLLHSFMINFSQTLALFRFPMMMMMRVTFKNAWSWSWSFQKKSNWDKSQ